jgi:hypothetical protein
MPSALELKQPPTWVIPGQEPLNTRTFDDDEDNGAPYKVMWMPFPPRRVITSDSNSTGEASFLAAFNDKARFEIDVLGHTEYQSGLNYLKRFVPQIHGDPADTTLYLRRLEETAHYSPNTGLKYLMSNADGNQAGGQLCEDWPAFECTLYRGEYIQRDYEMLRDDDVTSSPVPELKRYLTRFPEVEAFHRKTTQWQFVFDDNHQQVTPAYGALPQYCLRFNYVTYQWPFAYTGGGSVPLGTIARTLGKVNDSVFDSDMLLDADNGSTLTGFPSEELLYRRCALTKPYRMADSQLAVDILHVLDWNPYGWQTAIRPDIDDGSGGPVYGLARKVDPTNVYSGAAVRPFQKANFDRLFMPRGAP